MYYKKESIIYSNLPTFKSEIEQLCSCIIHCDIWSDFVLLQDIVMRDLQLIICK